MMNKTEQLTGLQKVYMDNDALNKEREAIHETWFHEDTTDYWRHKRMYELMRPLAEHHRASHWLTVGDGRYGLDAIRMKKLFQLQHVFPTDIGENMLSISRQKGWINDYGVENAEQLSFADNSFDVVFCKEAFHHFPRPYLALYEMLRVAKNAVVMIEPVERLVINGVKSKNYILSSVRLLISKLSGSVYHPYVPAIHSLNHSFETSGNYLYAVSVRELEKLAYGMDLPCFAWKGLNDIYIKGCEFEKAGPGNPLYDQIANEIERGDQLVRDYPNYYQHNMVCTILFKEKPAEQLEKKLSEAGFHLPVIHKNPYL